MTPAEIRECAIAAAVNAIENSANWTEVLTGFRLTAEDDDAIRADMREIANKIQRGSICDLSI